jgi:hypothetical protein
VFLLIVMVPLRPWVAQVPVTATVASITTPDTLGCWQPSR